jgi:hypothetical protein
MVDRPDNLFNLQELGRLFAYTPDGVCRHAKAGKLGEPVLIGRCKFYRIEAAEAYYEKRTTAEQRDAARRAPARYASPASKSIAAEKRERAEARSSEAVQERSARLFRLAQKIRDLEWRSALAKQGINFTAPEPHHG